MGNPRHQRREKQAQHPAAFSKTNGTIGHTPSSPLMTGKLKGQLCPQTCSPPMLSIQHRTQRHAPGLLQPSEVAVRVPLLGFTCGRWDMSQGGRRQQEEEEEEEGVRTQATGGADGRTARPTLQPWSNGAGSCFSQGSFPECPVKGQGPGLPPGFTRRDTRELEPGTAQVIAGAFSRRLPPNHYRGGGCKPGTLSRAGTGCGMARGDHTAAVSAATRSPRAGQRVTARRGLSPAPGCSHPGQSKQCPHPHAPTALSVRDAPALSHHGSETGVTAGAGSCHRCSGC